MSVILCLVALFVGVLIGTVGVGGILLIPALNSLALLSIHVSMGTALFSFIFTGVLGTILYWRHGSIDWGITLPVCLGSLISGYIGATVNGYTSAWFLQALLGAIIVFAGIYALSPARQRTLQINNNRCSILLGIGALAGFGSGLTGVGGPVLSVPLMVILGFTPLTSIATSQVIQITAALSGSLRYMADGSINFNVAAWVTLAELCGVVLGVRLAHSVSTAILRKIVSSVCILVGTFVLLRAFLNA